MNWRGFFKTFLFAFFAASLFSGQAAARSYEHASPIDVAVISDERGWLQAYPAELEGGGALRSYVVARENERYLIRVQNRSGARIGLVIAVDGRNIISGRKSHLRPDERMYILDPYESGEYEGWRTGRNSINRFYFTEEGRSYSAAWGDYSAMGVIAVAAYQDRNRHRPEPDKYRQQKRPDQGPLNRPRLRQLPADPGTGFGRPEYSPSRPVRFSPGKRPVARHFIKYEWRTSLCRKGIISCRDEYSRRGNRFWPEMKREKGFAPFPPPFWFRR